MKVIYVDTKKNTDYYISGCLTMKVRLVFWDDDDLFVYYTEDTENAAYINRVFNKNLKPNIFDYHNLLTIEDDEQFERYSNKINELYNFQALSKEVRVDGSDEDYSDDNKTSLFLGK